MYFQELALSVLSVELDVHILKYFFKFKSSECSSDLLSECKCVQLCVGFSFVPALGLFFRA